MSVQYFDNTSVLSCIISAWGTQVCPKHVSLHHKKPRFLRLSVQHAGGDYFFTSLNIASRVIVQTEGFRWLAGAPVTSLAEAFHAEFKQWATQLVHDKVLAGQGSILEARIREVQQSIQQGTYMRQFSVP